jgi:hypothetical protein
VRLLSSELEVRESGKAGDGSVSDTFVGIVCGAVGVLLLWAGQRDAVVVRRLRRHGIRTRGLVVDNVRVNSSESGPSWVPVIVYADQRGYRVEFSPRMRGTGMGLATGHEVPVVYLPHDPQAARVFTRRHMMGPVLFVLLAGVAFLSVGAVITLH